MMSMSYSLWQSRDELEEEVRPRGEQVLAGIDQELGLGRVEFALRRLRSDSDTAVH